jgi:hypothetical protein
MKQAKSKSKKRKNPPLNSRDGIQKVNYVLSEFDFKKVEAAMKAVNWQYFDLLNKSLYYPNVEQLKETARYILSLVALKKDYIVETGGFVAKRYKDGHLSLHFRLADASTQHFESR